MLSSSKIVCIIKGLGVTHVVGLPDNGSRSLFRELESESTLKVISVSREGEAFGLASGLLVGSATPIVLIQNTGLLESGDAYRGMPHNMQLPLVIFIGYRGYNTSSKASTKTDSAANFLEPTLNAWQIPYSLIFSDSDLAKINETFHLAKERSRPHAVILANPTE